MRLCLKAKNYTNNNKNQNPKPQNTEYSYVVHSSLELSLCVHACMLTWCSRMHAGACQWKDEEEDESVSILGLSLNLEFTDFVVVFGYNGWRTSPSNPVFSSLLPSTRLPGRHSHICLSHGCWGPKLRSLLLCSKCSDPLNSLQPHAWCSWSSCLYLHSINGYILLQMVLTVFLTNKPDVDGVHICNPSPWETESQYQSQPSSHGYTVRRHLKKLNGGWETAYQGKRLLFKSDWSLTPWNPHKHTCQVVTVTYL